MWKEWHFRFVFIRYIENVFPGRYGVPRPWYFFLTRSYWCGTPTKRYRNHSETPAADVMSLNVNLEPEPTDLHLGVSIHSIKKIYRHVIYFCKNRYGFCFGVIFGCSKPDQTGYFWSIFPQIFRFRDWSIVDTVRVLVLSLKMSFVWYFLSFSICYLIKTLNISYFQRKLCRPIVCFFPSFITFLFWIWIFCISIQQW